MPDVEAPTADPFELATAAAVADIRAALDATAAAYEEHSGPVGHGTIRLRDPSAPPEPAEAAIDEPDEVAGEATPPEEPAAPGASATTVGHGSIRLRG
jgi:hypothetical protein